MLIFYFIYSPFWMFIIKFIFSCVTPAELFCIVLLYDKLVHRVKYIISYNGASAWLFFLQRVVLLNLIVFRASCEHSAFCLYQSNNLMSWHKHGCDTINRIWFDAWSSLIKESFNLLSRNFSAMIDGNASSANATDALHSLVSSSNVERKEIMFSIEPLWVALNVTGWS